jgi:hypothetical protein
MSDYSGDQFDQESARGGDQVPANTVYNLKLSVDVRSVKNLKVAGSITTKYSLNLSAENSKAQFHQFTSSKATPVRQQSQSETKLEDTFSSYEFLANKAQLGAILGRNEVSVTLCDGNTEVASVHVPFKMLEQGE